MCRILESGAVFYRFKHDSQSCNLHFHINVNVADDVCPYTNIFRYHDGDIIELYASRLAVQLENSDDVVNMHKREIPDDTTVIAQSVIWSSIMCIKHGRAENNMKQIFSLRSRAKRIGGQSLVF